MATRTTPHGSPSPPLLEVTGLRVQFDKLLAVADVGFSLAGGTLLGLIGPNGAGKSTLLRAVAGLQPPTRGLVRLMGERMDPRNGGVMRHIGFTPDTPPAYEDLSVSQFLQFIGRGYELPVNEVQERIDFWLDKVWLTEKRDQKVKELSRGMRQRLGIARTLLPNPSVILLDEPAAGLDPAGRVQFRQLLANLREQGKALIVSSHILSDMDEYCSHIAIMAVGRIVRFGTVAQVASHGHGTSDPGDDRRRYTIVFAHPVARVEEQLRAIPEVGAVRCDGDRAVIEYFADRDRAAALLAELVAVRKLPIASFAANASGLEEAYLRAGIQQVD